MEIWRCYIDNKAICDVDDCVEGSVGCSQRCLNSVSVTVVEFQPFHTPGIAWKRGPVLYGLIVVGHVSKHL